MDLHKLLERQLKRTELSKHHLPTKILDWEKLLNAISNAYGDADQAHYMISRSMAISSAELKQLNEKLEEAQEIARMGYWELNLDTDKLFLSDQLCKIFGGKCVKNAMVLSDWAELVSPSHVNLFNEKFNQCIESAGNFDCELFIGNNNDKEFR